MVTINLMHLKGNERKIGEVKVWEKSDEEKITSYIKIILIVLGWIHFQENQNFTRLPHVYYEHNRIKSSLDCWERGKAVKMFVVALRPSQILLHP